MPFNGSGTFNLIYNWQNDAAQGINISSSRMMGQENDIASALSDCVTRDGQSPPTHDLPMGGFRLTNMANASAQGNAVTVQDVQNGTVNTLVTVAGTDTITATTNPPIGAYAAGQAFDFIPAGANLLAAPTLNLNGLGAKNLTKNGTVALGAGDLQANASYRIRYDGTQFQVVSPISTVGAYSFRNKLINGRFDVWQRGSTFSPGSGGGFVADRWIANPGGAGACTVSRVATTLGDNLAPGRYALQFSQTAGSASTPSIAQRIESVRTFAGNIATVSVTAYVLSGTLAVTPQIAQSFGTGGSPSAGASQNFTPITLTTTETTFTFSVNVASIAGKSIGTNLDDSVALVFLFPLSTTFTAVFTNVQIEEGGSPTPFESRPAEVEFALCQRYYQASQYRWDGQATSGVSFSSRAIYSVAMRASPTVTPTSVGGVAFPNAVGTIASADSTGFSELRSATATGNGTWASTYIATAEL